MDFSRISGVWDIHFYAFALITFPGVRVLHFQVTVRRRRQLADQLENNDAKIEKWRKLKFGPQLFTASPGLMM